MGRGQTAVVGQTRVAKNGYHYTKTEDKGWRLTHHITAEKKLGRPLHAEEIVQFKDKKYKRDPENPAGIIIIKKRTTSLRRRLAVIEAKIEELQAEKREIQNQISKL